MMLRNLMLLLGGGLLGLMVSLGSGVFAGKQPPPRELPVAETRLLTEVLERVRQEYVEPVDDSVLIDNAVRGMVRDLDPHSQFLDCSEYEQVRISTSGNYSGVGLEVQNTSGEVRVIAAIEGMPAALAGILPGDVIVAIDDEWLDERNHDRAVSQMRGPAGTPVRLSVRRGDDTGLLEFQVVRSNVRVPSVWTEMLADGIGYLRISHFSEATGRDARRALQNLTRRSPSGQLRGLVLDLRNNPGGVFEAAVEIADGFLDSGLIVSATGRASDASFSHSAAPGDLLHGAQLVVLVNGGSASSSEIVAAALRDHGRAMLVGTRTFGKGSVQTVMPLSNCRAVKLTTSRYFTPAGHSIQGVGISPDIEIAEDPVADALAGVAAHQTVSGARLLQTDTQLRAAFQLVQGERLRFSGPAH